MPKLDRMILVAMLLSILVTCRVLCARAECTVAHEQFGLTEPSQEAPHPINDDNCICNGGLQNDDVEPILVGLIPDSLDFGIDLCSSVWLLNFSPLSRPLEESGWQPENPLSGRAPESCAWLQRYRL